MKAASAPSTATATASEFRFKRATRETLNLRVSTSERGLIDRAAKSNGKTRTDFIFFGAARRAAEEDLLNRTVFVVSPAACSQFLPRLDAPPAPASACAEP